MIALSTWLWQARSSIPVDPVPVPSYVTPPTSPASMSPPNRKQWCLPKAGADPDALQRNIDYICGLGLDCRPMQEDGACFLPNTVRAHAAYAMNAYYQAMGRNDYDCDFKETGAVTTVDPS